jgi:hypothetical protein
MSDPQSSNGLEEGYEMTEAECLTRVDCMKGAACSAEEPLAGTFLRAEPAAQRLR